MYTVPHHGGVQVSPKGKKKKDKNAPMAARSAYQLYCNETRAELKEKGMSFGEAGKELGVRWKELGEAAKAEWQAKADEDKARHSAEMVDYVPPEVRPTVIVSARGGES